MAIQQVEKHQNLIFDLGLHQGEDTGFYLAKGFRVVAFEADPELVKNCQEIFAAELQSGQLTIVEGAIVENAAEESTVTFYKNSTVTVWGTVNPSWKERNERSGWGSEEITVATVDFGDCIKRFGVPYYVKIDIEGADMLSLGKFAEFEPKPDYISIESSKTSLDEIATELGLLESMGYDNFKAVQQATIPGSMAPRPAREGRDIDLRLARDSSGLFGKELAGEWKNSAGIRQAYKRIFVGYRVFGNDSFMRTNPLARPIWRGLQRLLGRPIPGWFDTHARHSSVGKE
jgi:FkbM family methyltransferase